MKKQSFNLKKFYKKAFYEGDRGYWLRNSRAWPNCLKLKMDGKNKSKHEAYQECIGEYNEWPHDKWLLSYSACYAGSDSIDHVTPGSKSPVEPKRSK